MRNAWPTALLLFALFAPGIGQGQEVIKGLDFWETRQNQTFVDLGPVQPLCNFQLVGGPTIPLRGIPLEQSAECPGNNLSSTSTIIRRLANTNQLDIFGQANVPIQIVGLHLQSVEPFTVIYQGRPEHWTLDVSLAAFPQQPTGNMIIRKQHPNGGTFDSNLPVRPHFTFTRVDPCPAVVRCDVDAPIILLQSLGAPWAYNPNPLTPILEIPGCTSNFFPGVTPFEAGSGVTPFETESGGVPPPGACHSVPGSHQHCVTPPPPPKLFQQSWQMAVHFTFLLQNISQKMSINDFHMSNPRYIAMNVPGPAPDSSVFIKSVSVCDTAKVCSKAPPDRWARVNWDSTDANFRKEAWWVFPPVPPKAMAPEMDIVFSLPCYAQPDSGAWFEVDYKCTDACAVVDSGTFRFHCPPMAKCTDQFPGCRNETVSVPESPQVGSGRARLLQQNFPNPFMGPTTIRFRTLQDSDVTLRIYDAQGRAIRTLWRGRLTASQHAFDWNARDNAGNLVKAGTYFYEIDAGGVREAKQMIVIR